MRPTWAHFAKKPSFLPTKSKWFQFRSNPRVRGLGQFGWYAFVFASWLPVVVMANDNFFEITRINGSSMYPLFNPDKDRSLTLDRVWTWKYNAQNKLARGMVVIFWSPFNPEGSVVKRVVGLPGDVIRTKPPYPVATVQVPPGHVWVEGDGDATQDSNTYGPIATGLIVGKVTHIVWPPHRFGRVKWEEYAKKLKYSS
ncbi:mitochondrial inner membrane protease subunit Imp2 [Apiospora saccharicola]|uniref:Mitochondrial inner membrane protease subunit 2 n=1 Tax=Apiospora saccharicola TaxID=335842 RepID=A0ABR1UPF4_9PEZI